MNKKLFYISVCLIFAFLIVGCSGTVTPSINFTGNWTMTNTSTYSTDPYTLPVGGVTTAKCNIVDTSGSLTIYNFRIIGQEFMNWSTGYGTRSGSTINANISGSYKNTYSDTVSTVVYFDGTIISGGISGTGTWTQTFSVYGLFDTVSGTTIFIKG